jgi:hypothetical protein
VEWNARLATEKPSDRVTVWRTLGALALGAVLGGIGMLCSRWLSDSPLLCTALQSAFSTMVLAVLTSARPQDLVLEAWKLHSSTQEAGDFAGQGIEVQPVLAAL